VPTVLKSGSLKLLEHSGPVQDCNGIALTFTDHEAPGYVVFSTPLYKSEVL